MPTYEYECKMCGHTFDVFQSMSDAPLKTCPECGKELRRLINGGSGIIFKGSGFYVTDKSGKNASEPTKPKQAVDKPVASESSVPSVAKSDTAEKVAG
ncbi:MAG: zinc ribbon domain-containing protein [Treponema sp.]|jgi:putative FmdB family regulatory protein|nr:zinc ribbon domain-containing protein [Treponema sp.]